LTGKGLLVAEMSFIDVRTQVFRLYRQGQYAAALDLTHSRRATSGHTSAGGAIGSV
jgi:hypothetical protein